MKISDLYIIVKASPGLGEFFDYDNIFKDSKVCREFMQNMAKTDPISKFRMITLDTAISEEKTNSFNEGIMEERNSNWS